MTERRFAALVRECLAAGQPVELDGLGVFVPGARACRFRASIRPRIFIAYVEEDARAAGRLFLDLREQGFDPWIDRRKLLPGQNWPRAIEDAIETSDFFLAMFSRRSVGKRGGFQAEIRYALDCARRVPLNEVFLVPLRLDDCRVPSQIQREWHYIDLFPDWDRGLARLLATIRRQSARPAA